MRNFIFDAKPRTSEEAVSLKTETGKRSDYKLTKVNNNGCVFSIWEDGLERDSVVFTMQDMKALYLLLTVKCNDKPIVIIRKYDRIAYLLTGVCTFYGISLPELRMTYRKKHLQKRRMAMKLLYDIADLRLKEIPSPLGYKHSAYPNINVHINALNDDMEYDKKLKAEYQALLTHMNI